MELKTTKAQLAKYFSTWLHWWINKNQYTQLQAAVRLGVTPGFINMIINKKRAASATQMEKIAQIVNSDVLDILIHGRQLLTGEIRLGGPITASENDLLEFGLDQNQIDSIQEYRALLLIGGEGVEAIAEFIRALARKKKISGKTGQTTMVSHYRDYKLELIKDE